MKKSRIWLQASRACSRASRGAGAFLEKDKYMRMQDASLELEARNPCPVCGAETALAEIEPHPLHVDFEIHGYICQQCGPIKSLVVLRASGRRKRN
jgi:hypothetical protein